MRAIRIAVAILWMSGSLLAQQRKEPTVSRTFIPDEPQPCLDFDRMASRLDAVYRVEEITKAEYDEGMKRYENHTSIDGVDYFAVEKGKFQRAIRQRDKLSEFIRWYATAGGRKQMSTANVNCNTEMRERVERYSGIYDLRQLQDVMTIAQAEGLLADAALEGQNVVIKALLESEAEHKRDVERYNKLIESVNSYNKAVNDLVVAVNTAMSEPKGSKLAPSLSFNFVRLPMVTCTPGTIVFTDATSYLAGIYTEANVTPLHCE